MISFFMSISLRATSALTSTIKNDMINTKMNINKVINEINSKNTKLHTNYNFILPTYSNRLVIDSCCCYYYHNTLLLLDSYLGYLIITFVMSYNKMKSYNNCLFVMIVVV